MIFFQIQSKCEGIDPSKLRLRLKYKDEFVMEPYVSHSLYHYLLQKKNEITQHAGKWDRYKKYTNAYEYVHTIVPELKQSICRVKPLSRSFYKMIEITQCFHILKEYEKQHPNQPMQSFHIAEGPGGFIEALLYNRKQHSDDVYYGMTLQSSSQNTPGWKKSGGVLNRISSGKFRVVDGADGSGDVSRYCNYMDCVERYRASMDIVTADGGFDFTVDFNKQEMVALRLVISEVFMALAIQKRGGYFILKIYDIFMKATIQVIYLLCNMYENVFLYKPHMSRSANSEKYIVCKNMLTEATPECLAKFGEIIRKMEESPDYVVESIIDVEIDNMFLTKMNDICSVIGQQQLENISVTLNLIMNPKSEKIESYKKSNMMNCINWCIKHNLPYNEVNVNHAASYYGSSVSSPISPPSHTIEFVCD